eukprot:CAMPEP_0178403312 /NCGR_PEP_ID=MMETSP0689_2-20121128/17302_1 /TAXON_ID=160604 /ORGANISM="Amphidinium massartii, Strain CS-259" /LENGTH=130 /DNA_ID=CAMNT_0020024259 /DNA_START=124 /DNA_END=516 /DNA_ORIENTATION=-
MSLQCFNCGGDHYARDCPEPNLKMDKGGKGKMGGGKGKSKGCFNCGGDHLARDCPEGGGGYKGGKSGGKGGGKSKGCFNCGGDHLARDCPEGNSKGGGKGKGGGGKGICYDFRDNGNCRFGDECRFSHNF